MGKNPEKMHNSTNTMLNWSSSVRDATDYMPFDLAQRRNCNTVTVDLHFAQTSGACAENWKLFAVHVLDRLSHLWELQHWPRRGVRDEITNEQSQLRKQVSSKATANTHALCGSSKRSSCNKWGIRSRKYYFPNRLNGIPTDKHFLPLKKSTKQVINSGI